MLLFFCGFSSQAQHIINLKRSHSLHSGLHKQLANPSPDSLTIIAVRVAFQKDDNRFTSGDGTFGENSLPYLADNAITIDPLPHDRAYFEAHLEFAKNYFRKVSGNKLQITYNVLPTIYRLDKQMEFYSPVGESFTNKKLAFLARDVWQKVEEQGGFDASGLDPQHTAFIIFHAGVGRDIELVGTTLDKTPQDIPSLFLSKAVLSGLLDQPSFEGFSVNNGTLKVTNSLILPRTLSRRGEDITGQEFVLQLSTNGLICASIGSYLGLPDLFNTRTGSSGIGRFGLMDGESFFSYRGLFPPEPSAWEKSFLGWERPFEISLQNNSDISLPAVSLKQPGSMARYSLSPREYFLVENRHRDPRNDGATITIRRTDGSLAEQNFTNRDEKFTSQGDNFEELLEPGVLIDVDNFDWSLPGGLDRGADGEAGTTDDRLLNGGMLIWHIDENVIQNEMERQAVNANPDRRGVDLEEADGAQDIGNPANDTFTEEVRGTAFDFWWSGNNASVITLQGDTLSLYQNRFAADTRPSNQSNSGAPSFFEFFDFSENLPIASFRARRVSNSTISTVPISDEPVPGRSTFIDMTSTYLKNYPPGLSIYTAQSDTFLIIPAANSVYALQLNTDNNGFFDFRQPAPQQPFTGDELILAPEPANSNSLSLNAWIWTGNEWQDIWQTPVSTNKGFLSSTDGDTLLVDFTRDRLLTQNGSRLPGFSSPQQRSVSLSNMVSVLRPGNLSIAGTGFSTPVNPKSLRLYTGALQLEPGKPGFYLLTENNFSIIDPGAPVPVTTIAETPFMEWPALVDLNGDNRIDILYIDGFTNQLIAKNQTGAVLDYFPVVAPEGSRFTGTPLVADIEGDQSPDFIIAAQDSLSMNLYAFGAQGKPKEQFPLFVGSVEDAGFQPVHPVIFNNTLYAVSHKGTLKAWNFPQMTDVLWKSKYGNEPYSKITGRITGEAPPQIPQQILVEEETYNWPNPAHEQTHIRYQTRRPGKVEIKIITVGGAVIFNKSFDASGGIPEEQLISTASWGNGIYLAMVTATVDGQQARKMIKIAVIH